MSNNKNTDCGGTCDIKMDINEQKADSTRTEIPDGFKRQTFFINNMDCPTEQDLIEKKLLPMQGIAHLQFNLLDRKLTVEYSDLDIKTIKSALTSIGMNAVSVEEKINSFGQNLKSSGSSISLREKIISTLALTAAISSELVAWIYGDENAWFVILLAAFAILSSGLKTYQKGWIALKNFNLNINALMAIAVTGALLIGQWPEAAMVMVLFTIAEMIETLSLERARNAIHGLMALTPEVAMIKQADGQWLELETSQVTIGAIVRIKPGERIPLDGEVISGQSAIDQSPITGESMPVTKTVDDKVFAGTINQTGSFEYKVTALSNQSTLARIIKSVEQAQSKKAPTQRFVDQFAKVYTPTVFVLAILVALLPPIFWAEAWEVWIYKSLVLLVIACPCALVISTPVTVVSGLAAAAKHGILVKGGVYLEGGHSIEILALDKTGTITSGKPVVTDVVNLIDESESNFTSNLFIAASLASRSDHPVSLAIAQYVNNLSNGEQGIVEVNDFMALTGRGIQAVFNQKIYTLGNHRLLKELGLSNDKIEQKLDALESQSKSVVILTDNKRPLLLIAVADTVKETSRNAISELNEMDIKTVMLTGDNIKTAKAIADDVGLVDFKGELLPDDKLNFINSALTNHQTVAMVGDGINDAPALAAASIGFAMGAAGTDTAIETADVALMDDDLGKIPKFIKLSKKTSVLLKQNISIALGIKVIFMVLAFAGMATLWMAVFADMGASLIVVANGLRLLRD